MNKLFITSLWIMLFSSVSITVTHAAETDSIETFDVINIKQGQSLPMHAWPSSTSQIVVALPHNTQSLVYQGKTMKQGERIWKKVYWNGNEGWVNENYLQSNTDKTRVLQQQPTTPAMSQTTPSIKNNNTTKTTDIKTNKKQSILACGGSNPFWNIRINLTTQQILVDLQDGKPFSIKLDNRQWNKSNNEMTINGGQAWEKRTIKANLLKTNSCTDGLTNIKYPFSAQITINNKKRINGCCRSIEK